MPLPFVIAQTTDSPAPVVPLPPPMAEVRKAPAPEGSLPDALGLAVSWVSGSGLFYRHWFDENLGVQAAGVPFITGDVAFLNFGAQAMYRWINRHPYQLYGLVGVGYAYNKNTFLSERERVDMGVAPGLGFDYAFTRNLHMTLHVGYTFGAQVLSGKMTGDFKPGFGLGAYYAF